MGGRYFFSIDRSSVFEINRCPIKTCFCTPRPWEVSWRISMTDIELHGPKTTINSSWTVVLICIAFNPIWHGRGYLYSLVPFGSDSVSNFFFKNFRTFLQVKIDINWTIHSATTFLEKCRNVVLDKWFCKLGFFFLVNHFSWTRKNVDI